MFKILAFNLFPPPFRQGCFNALINSNLVSFSLIPGTDDTSDSFFSYDVNTQTGAGNVNYTAISQSVPEPPVIPGLLVLWLLAVATRVKLTK